MNEAIVFLADGFEEIEALTPVDYLRRAGVKVITASCSGALMVKGAHGVPVQADMLVDEAFAVPRPELVVIPGGMPGAANIASCEQALALIQRTHEQGGVIAAICASPVVVLAKLKLLAGKRYTCYPGMEAALEQWAGSDWQALTAGSSKVFERVVTDGKLITGCGPGAAEEFALEIVRVIAGERVRGELAGACCSRA